MKARAAAAASRTPSRARARPISWRRSTLAAGRGSSGSPTPAWAGEQAGEPRPNSEEAEPSRAETQQRNPEAEQRNPERYQRKTFPRIGPFQWVTTIPARKRPPPCRVRGRLSPTILKIARNSDFHKEFRRRRHQGVMAGLVPAIPEGPAHRRRQARKALRPSAFLPVAPRRDSFLRRPGVDGRERASPAMTARVQNKKPTKPKPKFALLSRWLLSGKKSGAWRRWRTAPSRRHGRACPGHPRRPSASTQASAKSLDRPPSCRSRRGGTRSCGGPAWMAGTSPAMTARVRRTNSKPVDQQITP